MKKKKILLMHSSVSQSQRRSSTTYSKTVWTNSIIFKIIWICCENFEGVHTYNIKSHKTCGTTFFSLFYGQINSNHKTYCCGKEAEAKKSEPQTLNIINMLNILLPVFVKICLPIRYLQCTRYWNIRRD